MSEELISVKEYLGKAKDLLEDIGQSFIGDEVDDLSTKIQDAINTLVQNEKKIWLRTKKGREMLGESSIAAQTLIRVIEAGSDPDGIRDAVSEVERQVKTLSEEIRKRSMVVT